MDSKQCTKCGEEKNLADFYRDHRNKDARVAECKLCLIARQKELYEKDPERKRRYQTKNKLKTLYGLTPEDRIQMLEDCGYKCEICSREVVLPSPGCKTDNANIDHNHGTGKVRGILCGHCNKGLGHFMDDISLMEKAIAYLKERN